MRLRQAVIVAPEVEPAAELLREQLGLGAPYADPLVAEFGIANAVMALGDTFIEVIAPVRADAPAARWLDRHGPGGYMLIIQVEDVEPARARAARMGIRTVWQKDLHDISGTHLHPADTGGTLLSLDAARPPGSWRWAGSAWTDAVPEFGAGEITGATIAVRHPTQVAARWGALLDRDIGDATSAEVRFEGGAVRFIGAGGTEGIVGIDLALPGDVRAGRSTVDACGVRFRLSDAR